MPFYRIRLWPDKYILFVRRYGKRTRFSLMPTEIFEFNGTFAEFEVEVVNGTITVQSLDSFLGG